MLSREWNIFCLTFPLNCLNHCVVICRVVHDECSHLRLDSYKLKKITEQIVTYAAVQTIRCERFPHSFSHVVAGMCSDKLSKIDYCFLCQKMSNGSKHGGEQRTELSTVSNIVCNNSKEGIAIAGRPCIK
jgi:hypothetical protein